ncbi:structural maintenance of chromosomes protein 2 [Diachasma alloeum]|uniref:Structural maintenance of chromosomes protein n=1 Tax=Diachasma alloeum TaxID=454923 RepID=A0A4E0S176_9HYME|nr:structural maintenance of chromosomes protein 2 [Diachasma alloeum]THK33140.1 structural maintenance of chromosomes 2 [Diachasma alloeum]
MYIKSIVLDGFKSYGKRIEVNGFDKEFNAITGLNGSGKSNILDAICFVLGITALGSVRATSLQELVYKSGQAGVKKATVTVTFDNRDRGASPLGYEHYEEIAVTRQVVIDGKNKYLINGTLVPNKRVHDLFCSVQLNVNNPHFLIMQGRITKVLNMKPLEILSMIEEAAGTRMYEEKKEAAMKTIDKKNEKLKQINDILQEEIGPKLRKLKAEREQFAEYQRVERELEHCRKIVLAWKYVSALKSSQEAETSVSEAQAKVQTIKTTIKDGEAEVADIETKIEEMTAKNQAEKGERLEALEQELKELETKESKLTAEANSNKESIKAEKKIIEQLKKNLNEDNKALEQKNQELQQVGGLFQQLREQDERDNAAVTAAQQRLQKISAGLLESADGENATLEQQLINAKKNAIAAQTEITQCQMGLAHSKEQLSKKEKEIKNNDVDYQRDSKDLANKEQQLKSLEKGLSRIDYDEQASQVLKEQKRTLEGEIAQLQGKIDEIESRYPNLTFQYTPPSQNFDKNSVKGPVCTLMSLKEKNAAYALDVAAGGRLYNIVVDNEKTSKALLQHGQLKQRATIIPLNKITGRAMDDKTINYAERLVGNENVRPALSLIDFPEMARPAMTWIYGQTLICKDMQVARTVAFNSKINRKCVTLEGDVVDPAGTLSGGAQARGGSVLEQIDKLKSYQQQLSQKQAEYEGIKQQLNKLSQLEEKYRNVKQQFDIKTHEVNMIRQRLQQTSHHQVQEEINTLRQKIHEFNDKMETAKKVEKENSKRANDLEGQLKDSAKIREKQHKDAENQLKVLQKKADSSRKEWEKHEQASETLNLEIKELEKTIENGREQLAKADQKLAALEEKSLEYSERLKESEGVVSQLQDQIKTQKTIINQQNKEIQKLHSKKEDILKRNSDLELEIKKLDHEINAIKTNAAQCKSKVNDLLKEYAWIANEKQYFGQEGTVYDFNVNEPNSMAQKMSQLERRRTDLSRNVNSRAMSLLSKEEERYDETTKRKKIVEADKKKILETVKHLEDKKKETLEKAWEQVNKDFGSIFSSLLPGAMAKLQKLESENVLDGLEVKVGFTNVWKESLGELSGGQRSLVALSLILAMLLFKPAPLYILDEVDAALDLSHTQNIGTMLKRHFKTSQFIIVSLKDGMFNNANVLFTTRFVDGMSTITRGEKKRQQGGGH